MGFNLTRSVGPAIGGAIVAAAGAAAAFAVNAASYLALIFVLLRWQPTVPANALPRETIGPAMAAGLRYVAMSPNIGKVLLRGFVFGFAAISILALLPLVARDIIKGGPLLYGVLLGSFGIGAVGGALISGWLRQVLSSEWCVRLAFIGFALCAAVAGLSTYPWLTCAALMIGGANWVIALSLFNVTVQLSTPRWVVGRALSLYQTATFGGMALGSWSWGLAAEDFGPDKALLASAALMIAGRGTRSEMVRPARPGAAQPRPAQSLEGAADRARSQAAQRPDRHHDRVHHQGAGHGRIPERHGGSPADPQA